MSREDLFADFPDEQIEIRTLGELGVFLRAQSKQIALIQKTLEAHANFHRELRDDLHSMVALRRESDTDKDKRIDRLETKLGIFKYIITLLGSIGLVICSIIGYFIDDTWDRIAADHDRIIALEQQIILCQQKLAGGGNVAIPTREIRDQPARD